VKLKFYIEIQEENIRVMEELVYSVHTIVLL